MATVHTHRGNPLHHPEGESYNICRPCGYIPPPRRRFRLTCPHCGAPTTQTTIFNRTVLARQRNAE